MSADPLTRAALIGTEAAGLPPATTPAGALVATRSPQSPGWQLLLQAGAEGIYRRAATVAADVPAPRDPVEPAERQACSPAIARILQHIVSRHAGLVPWAVARLEAADLRVPAAHVPDLLESRHREAVLPVLGPVADWLAAQNPTWRGALGTAATAPDRARFEESTHAERVAMLRDMRSEDPEDAREWIATALPTERADVREVLMGTLQIGLSAGDEAFLQEIVSKDRGAAVRNTARWLLLQIPESAEASRALERALQVVVVRGSRVELQPPRAFDGPPKEAGATQTPPPRFGKRAWWALQLIEQVPPSTLAKQVGRTPKGLLTTLVHEPAFAYAWTRALKRWPDPDVARALWRWWQAQESRPGWIQSDAEAVAHHLSLDDAETYTRQRLAKHKSPLPALLKVLPVPWSDTIARSWLAWARRHPHTAHDDQTGAALLAAASGLPQALIPEVLELASSTTTESNGWRDKRLRMDLDMLAEALQARLDFDRHLHASQETS